MTIINQTPKTKGKQKQNTILAFELLCCDDSTAPELFESLE